MNKTKILTIFILVILSFSIISPVFATITVFKSESLSRENIVQYGIGDGNYKTSGWAFQGNGQYLHSATVDVGRKTTTIGYFKMVLYENTTNLVGKTLGQQTIVATSTAQTDVVLTNVYNDGSAGDNLTLWTFNFNYYLLDVAKYYYLALIANGTLTDRLYIGHSDAGGAGGCAYALDDASAISSSGGYTIIGSILTDDAPLPTATPTPTPVPATPTPTPDMSYGIWSTIAPYSTLLLPLIIILVVVIICGKFGGVWGFFAGLNVICILIYVIMGAAYFPLWGIILLAVVDAMLLFGKVSGRI